MSEDERPAVILDCGSAVCRAGFAGDDAPRSVFDTRLGHMRLTSPGDTGRCRHVGDWPDWQSGIFSIQCPIQRGIVTDWDAMEAVWHHAFSHELQVDPSVQPVLMSEPALSPRANREKAMQVMFETFQVPAAYGCPQGKLSCYSMGHTVFNALQCGEGVTETTCIYEGSAVCPAVQRLELAGCDVTNYLMKLLNRKGYQFTTTTDREIVQDIKAKLAYVAFDYDAEKTNIHKEQTYQLPDGQVISIGKELFQCTEALFHPSLLGSKKPGIHELLIRTLQNCDIDTRRDLYYNIFISGGSTLCPGFAVRLQKEIAASLPKTTKIRVVARSERGYATWIGGSLLASLSLMSEYWITKSHYEEYGPTVVHRMCPLH